MELVFELREEMKSQVAPKYMTNAVYLRIISWIRVHRYHNVDAASIVE